MSESSPGSDLIEEIKKDNIRISKDLGVDDGRWLKVDGFRIGGVAF